MHALPLMIVALSALAIGYRYYSAFLAAKVAALDDARETPAHTLADGQNYHATNKWVLFGHHFAAISGAGPLVGPVLAAQFGYLPGLIWLIVGVVLAGAAQDFLVLAASLRHGGKSIAEIARAETSPLCGRTAIAAILFIVIISLAGLGLVVKKALGGETVPLPANTRAVLPEGSLFVAQSSGNVVNVALPPKVRLEYPGGVASTLTEGARLAIVTTRSLSEVAVASSAGTCAFPFGCSLVVKGSSWGTFTIACTIPIALFIGFYMYRLRKGKVSEASAIGAVLVLVATWGGAIVSRSSIAGWFEFSGEQITVAMAAYGFIASVLPVWLLLCPRDYLSSYLKIGTIAVLVLGTLIANPRIELPPVTQFAWSGDGPVIKGKLFPFVFITIMCGAISGFHSLVASGTTPKMVSKESHARMIGYGAMLMEGLVGIVALIAASSLPPQDYFAINTKLSDATNPVVVERLHAAFPDMHEDNLPALEAQVEEQLRGRAGGAVSLAVGMSNILAPKGSPLEHLVSYWYHFAIMFEALFILTTIDTGTRIARFLLQEALGSVSATLGRPSSIVGAVVSSLAVVSAWGWFIWTGNVDSIWPMFGIANQLLAVIALSVVTSWIVNSGRARYMACTVGPLAFVTTTTMTAGAQLIERFWGWTANPAQAFNGWLNLILVCVMLLGAVVVLGDSVRAWVTRIRAKPS